MQSFSTLDSHIYGGGWTAGLFCNQESELSQREKNPQGIILPAINGRGFGLIPNFYARTKSRQLKIALLDERKMVLLPFFFPYKNETRKRHILLTEAISNNFCQPTHPGPRSSCAICMVISTGAGDWKDEECLWNSGWTLLPTLRTQGLCTSGWPHWTEAQGGGAATHSGNTTGRLCRGGARALLGRLCRQGCHVEPMSSQALPPRQRVTSSSATPCSTSLCSETRDDSECSSIWLFLMLRSSVFPKKSNGCCFQKFT